MCKYLVVTEEVTKFNYFVKANSSEEAIELVLTYDKTNPSNIEERRQVDAIEKQRIIATHRV